ncbi:MAG: TetR family transcriptional regulator [Microbacteriaceae bacterium]|nr:TetR family transcriptional regulator [Microbacteriaceae bacterium]
MARLAVADRRKALVQAALRVIERDGVHEATTRAIVAEAGMPLASFHYAFRSRDELIRELIGTVVEGEGEAAAATLEAGRSIRDSVRAGLQAYFDLLVADPNREQAMFELLHYALRNEELRDLPPSQYSTYWRTASSLLSAAETTTNIKWKLPIEQVAQLLVNFISGLTLAWLATRDGAAAARTMDFAADSIATLAEQSSAQS